ncbi:MAG: hypothetical protein IT290_10510 [Deltaproteobacteria bacterium]|nr:hypothetical protein [Deltaproteobacteria bacterium]
MRAPKSYIPSTLLFGALFAAQPVSALTGPSNYWECVLSRLPNAQTDSQATATRKTCRCDFPDFYWRRAVVPSTGVLAIFSETAQECVEENATKTPSRIARDEIRQACRSLYPPE